jgi:protoporphyrin/coproporphyrin ferrochelatase
MWRICCICCGRLDGTTVAANLRNMTGPGSAPKLAIVLFNLGGPDKPAAIRPFLVNLFADRAILNVPLLVRFFLARYIAYRRTGPAREIYARMGGKSPLLELTEAQASALEAALPEMNVKCFVAMRYWHPFSDEAARAVRDWKPDRILLLPLYPQYSTTTTGSSLTAWREAAAKAGLAVPVTTLCCYHSDSGYAAATAAILRRSYDEARAALDPAIKLRVLFSAHGLPERIVKHGDPYQFQIERSVAAIIQRLGLPDLDSVICYQSRATPERWIGPATDDEVARAAADKVALLVMPIAFVSEHSETLVELGIEYRELAHKLGVPGYFCVPTQNSDPGFIAALADLVRKVGNQGAGLCSFAGGRTCPRPHGDCPHARAEIQTAA